MTKAALLLVAACGAREAPVTSPPAPIQPLVEAGTDGSTGDAAPAMDAAPDADADEAAARARLVALGRRLPLEAHPAPPPPKTNPMAIVRTPIVFETSLRTSRGMPWEIVRRIMRMNLERFRTCYETELHDDRHATARIVMRVIVDKKGKVLLVEPVSANASPTFTQCVKSAFAVLSFPELEDADVFTAEIGAGFET